MWLKLVFCLVCLVISAHGQPDVTAYTVVGAFTCNDTALLERIVINSACGTLLSPCFPDSYTEEIDGGVKLFDVNYIHSQAGRTVAGYQLTFNEFITNRIGMVAGGIIYIGPTATTNPTTKITEASREVSVFGDGSVAPGFIITTSASSQMQVNGYVHELDYPRWYMNFYSSLQIRRKGFNLTVCAELNECDAVVQFCKNGGTCVRSSFKVYSCICPSGFTGSNCEIDIDECLTSPCTAPATCRNTNGSFACDCPAGYTGTGGVCVDINECTTGMHNCHADANCMNAVGSFTCSCKRGYTGNGVVCTDINECTDGTNNCSTNANCTNIGGSFTCTCRTFFTGDGVTCTDRNECSDGSHTCDINGFCTNLIGTGFSCTCNRGFSGDGMTCTDINECLPAAPMHNCSTNAACGNIAGGFTCSCNTGYTGNGTTCRDINECTEGGHNCHVNATCTNTDGGFTCACKTGFTGTGVACMNINECTTGSHNCDANANCMDTIGSFTCTCNPGYMGTGTTCTDVNECMTGAHTCSVNANCTNTMGSFTCACKNGYTGNGMTCTDINECALGTHNCNTTRNDQKCTNTNGSFICECNTPEYRDTVPNCRGYYCPGRVSNTANCIIPGIIEWPLYHDGVLMFQNNQEVSWFVNMTGQVNKTAIKFTFTNMSVQDQQDYLIFSTSANVRDTSAFQAVITGVKPRLVNRNIGPVSSANPTGFDVAAFTYILPYTEIYIHFISDRSIVSTGFSIRYDPDEDDCMGVMCQNGGSCVDQVFTYTCTNCPGYIGQNCSMDENECMNSTRNNCHQNATCTNTVGSFNCSCNAPSFTGNGTFCQPHLEVSNLVVTPLAGGTEVSISFTPTAPWGTNVNYIRRYRVEFTNTRTGDKFNATSPLTNASNFMPFTVSGSLIPYTNYTVALFAEDTGPEFSSAVFVRPADVAITTADAAPSAPTMLVVGSSDHDTVRISWTAPVEENRGKTTMYEISAQRTSQDCATFSVPALPAQLDCTTPKIFTVSASAVSSSSYVLTTLIAYRTYNIRIRAFTSFGAGPWSNNATAFTGIECASFSNPSPPVICSFVEASINSDNFPQQYRRWNDTFYSVNFTGQGAIRLVFDFFATEPNQDFLDVVLGDINFMQPIQTSSIAKNFSGDLTGTQAPVVFTEAQTGGFLSLRFHADLYNSVSYPGFQIHYETNATRCSPDPCINGGMCSDIPFDFQCTCPSIWGGKVCNLQLVNIDVRCSSNTPTGFTVNWNVTDQWKDDTTVIAGYTVTYSGAQSGTSMSGISSTSFSATGFTAYQQYTVTVQIRGVSPATVPTSSTCSGFTQQQAPDAPTAVTASATSPSVIRVTWTPPAVTRGVISGYTVQYTTTDHATYGESVSSGTVTASNTATSVDVTGLLPYRTYSVAVRATTGGGTSPASVAASARTMVAVPNPVTGLTLTPAAQSMSVAFTPPTVTGPLSYEVQYVLTSGGTTATVTSTTTPVSIPSLLPFTSYTVNVFALTSAGRSTMTTAVMTTLEDAPGPVSTVTFAAITPTSMEVRWTAPSQPNGAITRYRVAWTPVTGTGSTVAGLGLTTTITGLTAYTDYTVSVYASTSAGEGMPRTDIQKTAQTTPTDPVTNLTITPQARSMSVSFDAPAVVTGVFSYDVEYYVTSAGAGSAVTTTFTSNSGTISTLLPNTAYTINVTFIQPHLPTICPTPPQVYPKTVGSNRGPVATMTTTLLEDTPGAVSNLALVSNSFDTVQVTWAAPNMPNGVITAYRVEWTPGGGGIDLGSTATTHTISSLTAYTNYTVTVVASTAIGQGVRVSDTIATVESVPTDPVTSINLIAQATSVGVSFVPPATVTGVYTYQVRYYVTSAGSTTAMTQQFTTTSDSITGLLPHTAYTIEVSPQTTAGIGSATTMTITTAEAAPVAVASVNSGGSTFNSLTVNWPAPMPPNGVITGYRVTWVPATGGGSAVVSTGTSHTISGLTAYTEYTVMVFASTAAGEGPGMSTTLRTAEAVPAKITTASLSSTATSIAVVITPPNPANGVLVAYMVSTSQDNAECVSLRDANCITNLQHEIAANGNNPVTVNVPNLVPYRTYLVTIRANTSVGYGAVSDPFTFRTLATTPQGSATNVNVVSLNATSALVSWMSELPVPGNSSYTITLTALTNPNINTTQTVVSRMVTVNNTAVLTNLLTGHGYSVVITQSTSSGSGTASSPFLLYRAPTIISGAPGPILSPTQALFGASPTHAFQIENPCNRKSSLFSEIGGVITAIQVIVWQTGAAITTPAMWADAINQNPIPPYVAGTIQCTTASGRKKRALTPNGSGYVIGAETCTTANRADCNGPLISGRQYNVAYRGVNGLGTPSDMTASNGPFSTSVQRGLEAGEIAAIVISSIVVLLLIICLVYYCVKRRRSSGAHTVSGRDNRSFDDSQKQRYKVEAASTDEAATTYSQQKDTQ